jgi:hypothetical protein
MIYEEQQLGLSPPPIPVLDSYRLSLKLGQLERRPGSLWRIGFPYIRGASIFIYLIILPSLETE